MEHIGTIATDINAPLKLNEIYIAIMKLLYVCQAI